MSLNLINPTNTTYSLLATKFAKSTRETTEYQTVVSTRNEVEKTTECKNDLKATVANTMSYDAEDHYIKVAVVNKDGNYYVRLSRVNNDERHPKDRDKFDLAAIKEKLGLNDGVLKDNNDLEYVTNRKYYVESGTIEPGKHLDIPIDALGMRNDFRTFVRQGDFKNLKDKANALKDAN